MFQKHSKSKSLEDKSIVFFFLFSFLIKVMKWLTAYFPWLSSYAMEWQKEGLKQSNKGPRSQKAPESSQPSILLTQ